MFLTKNKKIKSDNEEFEKESNMTITKTLF